MEQPEGRLRHSGALKIRLVKAAKHFGLSGGYSVCRLFLRLLHTSVIPVIAGGTGIANFPTPC